MSRVVRDRLGKFRKPIKTAYEAGWDSIERGADQENCHFAWFTSPERTKEWEAGRDAASEALSNQSKPRTSEANDAK